MIINSVMTLELSQKIIPGFRSKAGIIEILRFLSSFAGECIRAIGLKST
jgi:hypothetical protein